MLPEASADNAAQPHGSRRRPIRQKPKRGKRTRLQRKPLTREEIGGPGP
jgi:hypothetical protein